MSLENIRSECSEYAALLQPHVDGELADEEQHRVSDHLEKCGACRTAVSEQMWVRATLRSIDREAAPTGLRANVLAALDVADAEQPEHAPGAEADGPDPKGQVVSIDARRGGRVRDLIRGGMVMIPAAAVAAGLFFVARGGLEPVQQLPGPGLSAAMSRAPVAGPPAEPRREPPPANSKCEAKSTPSTNSILSACWARGCEVVDALISNAPGLPGRSASRCSPLAVQKMTSRFFG